MNPAPYNVDYDLTSCSAEPIHLIRHYQSFASLVVITAKGQNIVAFSDDLPDKLGLPSKDLFRASIKELLPAEAIEILNRMIANDEFTVHNPIALPNWGATAFSQGTNLIVHQLDELIYLEFEPRDPAASTSIFLQRVDQSLQLIQAIGTKDALFQTTVQEVRQLTGFDRVMLYHFDEDYNGQVIGEAKEDKLDTFLHLRYPHTDIPRQARDIMLKHPVRQVISSRAEAVHGVLLSPEVNELDLTYASGRGSSPIHLEYLRNMGVKASLTISIILEGKLWGLIACHHYEAERLVDYRIRQILGFMAKIVSSHLAFQQHTEFRNSILQSNIIRSRLFERMNQAYKVKEGLLKVPEDLLKLTAADGVAILLDDEVTTIGQTPDQEEILALAESLPPEGSIARHSERAVEDFPLLEQFNYQPGGILSVRLNAQPREYIIWFRASINRKVTWAGNPELRKEINNNKVRLHPELSFQKWEQIMRHVSAPWEEHHINVAISLRNDIKEVVLLKYNEMRQLNSQLVDAYEELESFSYTVSHDLRAPLRNIKGFAEILQEDYLENLDDYGKEALNTIIDSAGKMNQFINDILAFSRLGRTSLIVNELPVENLINDIWETLNGESSPVSLIKEISTPIIRGDHTQINQLLHNLLSNAIKYAKPVADAFVKVKLFQEEKHFILEVADNGIGFNMKYADRIFAVFNRLVSEEDYEGTGVGLAITRRVAENHGGKISVFSEVGIGTTFTIRLPTHPVVEESE